MLQLPCRPPLHSDSPRCVSVRLSAHLPLRLMSCSRVPAWPGLPCGLPLPLRRCTQRLWTTQTSVGMCLQEVGRHKAGWCHLELDLGSVVLPRPLCLRFLSCSSTLPVCQTCVPPSLTLSPCMQSSAPMPLSRTASAMQLGLHFTVEHPANAPVKAGACHHGPLFWSCPLPQASRCALYVPSQGSHSLCLAVTFSPCHCLPLHAPRCLQVQPPSGFGHCVPRPQAVDLSAGVHPQEVGRRKAGQHHLELNLGSVVPPHPSCLRFLSHLQTPLSAPNLPAPGSHCWHTPAGSWQAQGQVAPFGARSWLCGATSSLMPLFPPPLVHAASMPNLRTPLPHPRSLRAKFCTHACAPPHFCSAAQLALRP